MYPVLQIKKGREKSLLNRHPWVFSGAIHKMDPAPEGAIVEIRDQKGALYGYGFYSQKSQISARVFEFCQQTVLLDEAYWQQKIQNAFQLRQAHLDFEQTNAFRLIHAEGDFFPGLIVDIYHQVAVVQILIKGTEALYPTISQALLKLGLDYVFLKTKENTQFLEGLQLEKGWWEGKSPPEVLIRENGHHFEIDVEKGQKTGFFLDQRENRQLLGTYAQGQKILNAFSYTGGFSLYALAGGAREVHSVDISQDAIERSKKIIESNFPGDTRHQARAEDCFDYLKKTGDIYDLIVLDPPAFAKNKKAVANAARGYISLNELGLKKLKPRGLLFTFSCSGSISRDLFRKIIFTASAGVKRNVRILNQLSQPLDHPINIYHPEGEYLKGLLLQVE